MTEYSQIYATSAAPQPNRGLPSPLTTLFSCAKPSITRTPSPTSASTFSSMSTFTSPSGSDSSATSSESSWILVNNSLKKTTVPMECLENSEAMRKANSFLPQAEKLAVRVLELDEKENSAEKKKEMKGLLKDWERTYAKVRVAVEGGGAKS